MGQQISEEEKQQLHLHFWKLWKYQTEEQGDLAVQRREHKKKKLGITKSPNNKCELILKDLVIQNAEVYHF